MMVAAHPLDLKAAGAAGLRTAFVAPKLTEPDRPGLRTEPTPAAHDYFAEDFADLAPDPIVDLAARDFNDLADQLVG